MDSRETTTISIKRNTKERLDKFRKSDRGTVTHEDAVSTLLDFWEKNHK